jgi:hypothetical protein
LEQQRPRIHSTLNSPLHHPPVGKQMSGCPKES